MNNKRWYIVKYKKINSVKFGDISKIKTEAVLVPDKKDIFEFLKKYFSFSFCLVGSIRERI